MVAFADFEVLLDLDDVDSSPDFVSESAVNFAKREGGEFLQKPKSKVFPTSRPLLIAGGGRSDDWKIRVEKAGSLLDSGFGLAGCCVAAPVTLPSSVVLGIGAEDESWVCP